MSKTKYLTIDDFDLVFTRLGKLKIWISWAKHWSICYKLILITVLNWVFSKCFIDLLSIKKNKKNPARVTIYAVFCKNSTYVFCCTLVQIPIVIQAYTLVLSLNNIGNWHLIRNQVPWDQYCNQLLFTFVLYNFRNSD